MKSLLHHSGRLLAGIQFFELLDPGQKHAGVTGLRDFIINHQQNRKAANPLDGLTAYGVSKADNRDKISPGSRPLRSLRNPRFFPDQSVGCFSRAAYQVLPPLR
jgi:hypothetical protein